MVRPPPFNLGPLKDTYSRATHRPLNCLVFLLPLIILYELGSMSAGPLPLHARPPDRVLAFYWIVQFIGLFGNVPTYLPGALLLIVLVVWHLITDSPRARVRWSTIGGMAIESFLFCVPLLVLYQMTHLLAAAGEVHYSMRDMLVIDVTAGIYEELIFRALLIWMFKLLLVDVLERHEGRSMVAIIVITGVMFSAYHYLGAEAFSWPSFTFRTAAGMYLGGIYVYRGLGITVGTHALYDIIYTLTAAPIGA